MLKGAIIGLLLTFALGCLAGCGDKALDPCACDDLLAEAASNREACDDLWAEAVLNREHGQLSRANELEEKARALGCTE